MNAFTIKDLENLSGIKAHTIRMWEQRYNFLKPQRSCTNIRCYTNEELKMLLNIALLNKYGVKISHIDKMQPDEICKKILSLQDAEAIQERIVNDLVRLMIDVNPERFETCLSGYIRFHGMEKTVKEIIFPFLEKIGILWQTGHIMPAQEHFVTNIVRQKLIVAIDELGLSTGTKKCMLFLPEGEHHELGLLFLNYMLKKNNAQVIYLGANVPMSDVESIVQVLKPDIGFIHLTSTSPGFNFGRLLQQLPKSTNGLEMVISGYPAQCWCKPVHPSIGLKRTYAEVMELVSNI